MIRDRSNHQSRPHAQAAKCTSDTPPSVNDVAARPAAQTLDLDECISDQRESFIPYTATPTQLRKAKKACARCGRLTVRSDRRNCKSCGSENFQPFTRQKVPMFGRTKKKHLGPFSDSGNAKGKARRSFDAKATAVVVASESLAPHLQATPEPGDRPKSAPISPSRSLSKQISRMSLSTSPEQDDQTRVSDTRASEPTRSHDLPSQPVPVVETSCSDNDAGPTPVSPRAHRRDSAELETVLSVMSAQKQTTSASVVATLFDTDNTSSVTSFATPNMGRARPTPLNVEDQLPNSPLLDLKDAFPTPLALSDYLRFTGVLGQGAYSTVFRGELLDSGRRVAIKCIDKSRSNDKRLELETESLGQSRHKNIVELIRVVTTDDTLYIVTELVEGGELFDRICDLGSFSEKDAAGILYQILDALAFLHDKGIVHRDIKPENILIGNDISDIKIADFGVATMVEIVSTQSGADSDCSDSDYSVEQEVQAASREGRKSKIFHKKSVCGSNRHSRLRGRCYSLVGSLQYMAPEIVGGKGYTSSVDMWSVGVLAHILVAGFPPYEAPSRDDLRRKSHHWRYVERGVPLFDRNDPIWNNISKDAKNFIESLMSIKPRKRPTAKQAIESKFIQRHLRHASASRANSAVSASSSPSGLLSPGGGNLGTELDLESSIEDDIQWSCGNTAGWPCEFSPCPDALRPEIAQQRHRSLSEISIGRGRVRNRKREIVERRLAFGQPVIGLGTVDESAPVFKRYAERRRRNRSDSREQPLGGVPPSLGGFARSDPTPNKQVKVSSAQIVSPMPPSPVDAALSSQFDFETGTFK